MISLPLFKATLRSNFKVILLFIGVLTMYFSSIMSMYDPNSADSMEAMLKTLPEGLVNALNFAVVDPTLVGFIAGYFYGFLILLFPLIYTIIAANRAIAKHVDRGSMAYLLSTPTTRVTLALTQATFLIGSVGLLIGFITTYGVALSAIVFPGKLDVSAFLLLNLGAFLLYFAISGIAFFASCLFNETKNSLAFGAGIPVAFLFIKMLSDLGDQLSGLRYVTLLTLFNPVDIVTSPNNVIPAFLALALLGLVLYGSAVVVFNKKDLPV